MTPDEDRARELLGFPPEGPLPKNMSQQVSRLVQAFRDVRAETAKDLLLLVEPRE